MKTISGKALIFAIVMIIAVIGIGVRVLDDYIDRSAWERAADVVYPMANQHIEWGCP